MAKTSRNDYFTGFSDCADCACRAATLLDAVVRDFNPQAISAQMDEIHDIEHESDKVKHKMLENLAKEFLPPIERSDISTLLNELDNVVDGIDEVMRLLCMFRIKQLRPDTEKFSKSLILCCAALKEVVQEFVNFKKSKTIKEKIIRVNSLESEADTLHFNALDTLFSSSNDTLNIITWKNIYDCFEDCFDTCEHAADLIEEIILTNS